jgi:AraC family transcriptional regulator, positive regulator of tynA and feaB
MPSPMASLLNLQSVGAAQRASLWARSARGFFPGVSVRRLDESPEAGRISSMPFGCGRIWSVLSPPLVVSYDPSTSHDDRHLFSVMIQLTGTTAARQQRRSCVLRAGDCCAIDTGAPFELEVPDESSYLVFLQMPRLSVLGRHPYLARHTAEIFDREETGTRLLRRLLTDSLESAAALENFQRAAALAAIIELLGVSKLLHTGPVEETNWRVLSALQYIGARFADPTLNAEQVADAQGISRRRLDKLMVQAGGTTVAAQIWKRRLSQVAEDLIESRLAARSVAQVGFAAGFADPAHLSRTFRRTFHCTPGEWRRRKMGAQDRGAIHEHPLLDEESRVLKS